MEEALSSAPKEEIEAVATGIEEGTYESRAPRNSTPAKADIASDSVLPETRQLSTIISDFANHFNTLPRQASTTATTELKSVLRSYIDKLDDLYKNIG